jgi:hypothetical protein
MLAVAFCGKLVCVMPIYRRLKSWFLQAAAQAET